jgi:hypothetical protein
VGGSFFLAITPTYIIVFVCLSATTDGKKKKTEQHRPKTRAKTQTQFQKETLSTSSSVAPISEPLFLLLEKERTKKKQKGAYSRD